MAIRIDKAGRTGFLASIKNTEDTPMYQGQVVELGNYAEADVFEATKVKDVASKKLVIHASVENETICEKEFLLDKDEIGRAYYPEAGQVFTIPKTMFDGTPAVNDKVEPAVGSEKWTKTESPTASFHAEIIEETSFGGQDCFVIHILV